MLGTLRSDGFPRISPMEPRFFEDELWISGMPNTTKFNDLARDPRFCLHTATVDTHVGDGDAKLWGVVEDVQDAPVAEADSAPDDAPVEAAESVEAVEAKDDAEDK